MIPVLYRFPDWIPVLGDQAITSFGALLLIAFVAGGLLFVRRLQPDVRVDPAGAAAQKVAWETVVTAAVGGIIGAKLLHLGIHSALGLPTGGLGRAGLNWFGGLIGGGAGVLWQVRRHELSPATIAAAAAPALALGYAIGRVGSFLVGADYGIPTTLPWGVAFPAGAPPTTAANLLDAFGLRAPGDPGGGALVRVHPTQLYEAALSLLILYALERRRPEGRRVPGWRLLGLFLILHGCARAAVELLRAKQDHLAGPVTADLLMAAAVVVLGIALRARTPSFPRATEPAA